MDFGIFDHEAIMKENEMYHKAAIQSPIPESFNEAIMCRDNFRKMIEIMRLKNTKKHLNFI